MKTTTVPVAAPKWLLVDAEGKTLGRLAADIAHVLRGKHRPSFSPHQLCGDHVIVINASKLAFDQRKLMQKQYVKHSGYLGHLQTKSLKQVLEANPAHVLEHAVQGMLPKNRLRAQMLKQLHVFAEGEHPHAAQKPEPLPTA